MRRFGLVMGLIVGVLAAWCAAGAPAALAKGSVTYRSYGSCDPVAVGVCTPKVISRKRFRRRVGASTADSCVGGINRVSRFYSDHYYVSSTAWQSCNGTGYASWEYGARRPIRAHAAYVVVAQHITARLWERIATGYYKAAGIGQYWYDNAYHYRPVSVSCSYLAARWWHSERILEFQTSDQQEAGGTEWYTSDANSDGLWIDCAV